MPTPCKVTASIIAGKNWTKDQIVDGDECRDELERLIKTKALTPLVGVMLPAFAPKADDLIGEIERLHESVIQKDEMIDSLKALLAKQEEQHQAALEKVNKENAGCYVEMKRMEDEIVRLKIAVMPKNAERTDAPGGEDAPPKTGKQTKKEPALAGV